MATLRRLLPAFSRRLSSNSTSTINPLLNLPQPAAVPPATAASVPGAGTDAAQLPRYAIADFWDLPVSPKKLRVVANLAPKLYWREAMAQLEFCRKNMAVMVKNCVETAVNKAVADGLDRSRLVVDQAIVGKGSYHKKPDFKARGKTGVRRAYFSHLRVIVREVDEKQLKRTKFYGRWSSAAKLLQLPWEERIKHLPRYQPPAGYDPAG